jgi:hypothetical protein
MFKNIYEIYKLENPDPKPTSNDFPTEIQIGM